MRSGGTEPRGEVRSGWSQKLGVGSADAQIMPGAGRQSTISSESRKKRSPSWPVQPFSHWV